MEIKTKLIEDGSHIVLELNEEGTVIDVRKGREVTRLVWRRGLLPPDR